MKYLIIGLSFIFLSACSGFNLQTSQPAQTQNISIITETPIKTPTVTPSPLSTAPSLELPTWMSNPNTAILAALIRDDVNQIRKIHFINPATEEKYELSVPNDYGGFFWYDNMNLGVIVKDTETAQKFNLQTGQITIEPVPPFKPDKFWKDSISINQNYIAQWDRDNKIITVEDTRTNEMLWELVLPENRYGTEIEWSPVSENHLAFLQGSLSLSGKITEDMALTIVDITNGEILSTYNGNFGMLEWSPNGKMILYLNPYFRYRNYGISFKDAPCLLILATNETKCLRSIPKIIPTGYELLTTGIYKWASDSNSIFFTYTYNLPNRWSILGNLCNYSLIDSRIDCATQGLKVLHERSVINYKLSPNEQFIPVCYSKSTLVEDAAGESSDGIIKPDGTGFFSWTGTILDGSPSPMCSWDSYWRPLP